MWNTLNSSAQLAIDEDLAKRAVADGSGAAAVQLDPRPDWEPNSLRQLREIARLEGFECALDLLNGFAEQHPKSAAVHVLRAECLRRLDRLEDALAAIEIALNLAPTLGHAHHVHARILGQQLEKLARQGAMGKIKAVRKQGPYTDALKTAIELDPKNVEARKEEILFHLVVPGFGDKQFAVERAEELKTIDALEGSMAVARALYYSGDQEAGLQVAKQTVQDFPDSIDAKWVLGSLLFDEKRYDEAEESLKPITESKEKGETYYQALYRRMRLRTRQQKHSEQVLEFVREFIEANPGWEWAPRRFQVLCEKGRALAALGRNAEAREAFLESLRLNPNFKRAKQGLAGLDRASARDANGDG